MAGPLACEVLVTLAVWVGGKVFCSGKKWWLLAWAHPATSDAAGPAGAWVVQSLRQFCH